MLLKDFDTTKFDRDLRARFFRPKYSVKTLNRRMRFLLDQLGESGPTDDPDTQYVSEGKHKALFEEHMHELAHHVALTNDFKFGPRRESIGMEIGAMPPITADGNELDTLAIELTAAWWLWHPLKERELVELAHKGSLNFYSAAAARRIVVAARRTKTIFSRGLALAIAIHELKGL